MTPAQRRKNLRDFKKKKTSKKLNIFILLALLFVTIILGLYYFGKRHCLGDLKISMVFPDTNGNIIVSTFNKEEKEITLINIPQNTQLEVSRQLGSWKAKSLWQLGVNEKYEGKLLQETVTKNFHFPVSIWANEDAFGFVSGNFIKLIKATLFPYKSNLSLGDRLCLFFISFGIQNEKINYYDLSERGVLKGTRLTDGEEGYVVSKDVPMNIMSSFSESISSDFGYMVQIVNATGSRSMAENIGKTIESMGFKITSIKEEASINDDVDCLIYGKDRDIVKKISLIYSCERQDNKNDEGFDIVIKLGSKFSKRY
ncbi:MAG: hypothetical protein ABIJ05_03980 [Patescibacteria group bacterium]